MSELPVTWPALLVHWTAFAQSSLALPRTAEGDRWRRAVPAIIGLQAIAHALGDLDRLAPSEDRALALDLAAVGIRSHAQTLEHLWSNEPMHDDLNALIGDARAALAAAKPATPAGEETETGVEWCVSGDWLIVDHPGELCETLVEAGFDGDLYLPVPGARLFKHAPAAFARPGSGEIPPEITGAIRGYLNSGGGVGKHQPAARARQVFRQFDFAQKRNGGVVRDVVVVMDSTPRSGGGQPQLIAAMLEGRPQQVPLPIPGMSDLEPVPVVFE